MLPSELIRFKIFNKGRNITPLFLDINSNNEHFELASEIIKIFINVYKNKEKKKKLQNRIHNLELLHSDYKLVRGLYTLLERRCIFDWDTKKNQNFQDRYQYEPQYIRKLIFEESSKNNLSFTEEQRKNIINNVCSNLGISSSLIQDIFWADLEDNWKIIDFQSLSVKELIGWYNLSILQTLLFNCIKLDFSVTSGYNWKRVLYNIKKLGLMYTLEVLNNEHIEKGVFFQDQTNNNFQLLCSVDGPLSIFKMTDKYGNAISKLVSLILESSQWYMKSLIIRRNNESNKIYEFSISNKTTDIYYYDPFFSLPNNIVENSGRVFNNTNNYFDSSIEEKFAKNFESLNSGWTLMREPDPFILSNGTAFIPDFMFTKYGVKVFLEIVGFWSNDYLERKFKKIVDLFQKNKNKDLVLFLAINEDTNITNSNETRDFFKLRIFNIIDKSFIFFYKNNRISIRPVISYLRHIDNLHISKYEKNFNDIILKELDGLLADDRNPIIDIHLLGTKYNIPLDSIVNIVKNYNFSVKNYFLINHYLIYKTKIEFLQNTIKNLQNLSDVLLILKENQIPDSCHYELLDFLNYDIMWNTLDISNAVIRRR